MRARKPRRTRRTLLWLALFFAGGVVAVAVIGIMAGPDDEPAVLEARARSAESLAQYERQFEEPKQAAPALRTEAHGEIRPDTGNAPALFESLTPIMTATWRSRRYMAAEEIVEERSPREWTEEDLRFLTAELGRRAELLEAIRKIAELGEPVYRIDLSKGYATELPHLPQLRRMAELLSIQAAVSARQGDTEAAVTDYLALLRLSETLKEEPILISQLVRFSLIGTVFDGIGTALEPGQLTPEQAHRIGEQAAGLYHRDAFVNAIVGETACGLQALDDATGSGDVPVDMGEYGSPEAEVLVGYLLRTPVGGAVLSSDRQQYAEYMNRLVQAAEKPYYEAQAELDAVERDLEDLSFLSNLTRVLVPPLIRAPWGQARVEAMLDLMRLGLLLEAYHTETGAYPDSLDAIANAFDGAIPLDPYTGSPYVYIPEGDSFLLYGLGPNQQDDGGRHDCFDFDIVWRAVERDD